MPQQFAWVPRHLLPRRMHLDMETFADPHDRTDPETGVRILGVDLKRHTVYNYAHNPGSGCYMFAVKLDHEPTFCVVLWKFIQTGTGSACVLKTEAELFAEYPQLPRFLAGVEAGATAVAHNAAFERWCWNCIICCGRADYEYRYFPHWPKLTVAQQDCTMARASAMGLPAGLGNLANVLRLKHRKLDSSLMMLLALSNPHNIAVVTPDALAEEAIYCIADVDCEAEADSLIYPLDPLGRATWELDQEINDRGIPVDVESIRKAQAIVNVAKHRANTEIARLTTGAVRSAQQAAALTAWLNSRLAGAGRCDEETGALLQLPGVSQFVLKTFNEDHGWGTDEVVPRVLELREYASRASVAKLEAFLDQLRFSPDNRIRGQYVFMGAGPGRWTGRGVQPQNLARFDDETQPLADALLRVLNHPSSAALLGQGKPAIAAADEAAGAIEAATGKNAIVVIGKCMRIFIQAGAN
jgi:DNA polymerase bacteriophage-type